jgi:chromosomal replication initiator protein
VDDTADPADIWASAISSLDSAALSRSHRAFLQLSRLVNVYGSVAVLAAPNPFAKDVLESHLRPPIEHALAALLGRDISLAVTVDPSLDVDDDLADIWADSTYADRPTDPTGPQPVVRPAARATEVKPEQSARLNPRYTFDTFVAGASNRFAHAAAVAVAVQPARSYNPLVIYGESGLG